MFLIIREERRRNRRFFQNAVETMKGFLCGAKRGKYLRSRVNRVILLRGRSQHSGKFRFASKIADDFFAMLMKRFAQVLENLERLGVVHRGNFEKEPIFQLRERR